VRLVYLGTPEASTNPLRRLVAEGHDVELVVTRADTRRGRGNATTASPVKAVAQELGIPVSHSVDDVLATGAELGVVVAFGRIIKPHVLARLPMVNLHFSLLPRWRGAAPVERAILAGDERTGVCLMQVAEGLDTGDVHACVETPIAADDTASTLRARLVDLGGDLLVRSLAAGLGDAHPQLGEPTYAAKITPDELRLDWAAPPVELLRVVRVGGAWTTFRGSRVKVLDAMVDRGRLVPLVVQPEGRGPMPFDAWCNGARPAPTEWFE
jgi:methionyl-tRNA formyltransferase